MKNHQMQICFPGGPESVERYFPLLKRMASHGLSYIVDLPKTFLLPLTRSVLTTLESWEKGIMCDMGFMRPLMLILQRLSPQYEKPLSSIY